MTDVAKLYGGSLYDLAVEEKKTEEYLQQLQAVVRLFLDEPDYQKLLGTQSIPKAERCGLLDEAFSGKIEPYILNFLKILCQNNTLSQLQDCARAFEARFNADHGILHAVAYTAVAMRPAQLAALEKRLGEKTGKTVHVTNRLDPSVLGGVRLQLEDMQLDGTLQGRLDAMRQNLASTVW